MGKVPERTCIGCRNVFVKDEVIRIVTGPSEIVIDYREKLPGRAAYVCPTRECIHQALTSKAIARSLKMNAKLPSEDEFLGGLVRAIEEKLKSLIKIAAKAGMLAAGYSAVHDALEKGRVNMLVYAEDISEGTKEKVSVPDGSKMRQATFFTRDEIGKLLNRELVGVLGILDKGLADAVWKESQRLKRLINKSE
jgi:predicted RNA-binding protein YlxR (DUF448 family)